ncbi:hypothetical protein [Lacunimicrobium album]
MRPSILPLCAAVFAAVTSSAAFAEDFSPQFQQMLSTKTLSKTAEEITILQKATPSTQLQTALGIAQFFQAIEHLGQQHYRYGVFYKDLRGLPLMRMPVPINENPEPINYEQAAQILAGVRDRLETAEKTLSQVNDPGMKLSFPVFLVMIDYNNNGKEDQDETLGELLLNLNPTFMRQPGQEPMPLENLAEQFVIGFDQTDVYWLRGYCHLLMSFCDWALAHEMKELYHVIAPRVYAKPLDAAEPFPKKEGDWTGDIADAIAGIHLARFPVVQKERYQSIRAHLKQVIALSRKTWEAAAAETDNDREWLPSPKQTGILQVPVTDDMVATWKTFLTESEEILDGKKLVAHWRYPNQARGVNLKKYFDNPPARFDLILMVHGVDLLPYIEKGEMTSPETWDNFNNMFQGNFFGYAVWFN